MPQVLRRSLNGFLAAIAVMFSSFGVFRATVERPFAEAAGRVPLTISEQAVTADQRRETVVGIDHIIAPEAPVAASPSPLPAPKAERWLPTGIAIAAPTTRLGAAGGPRAP